MKKIWQDEEIGCKELGGAATLDTVIREVLSDDMIIEPKTEWGEGEAMWTARRTTLQAERPASTKACGGNMLSMSENSKEARVSEVEKCKGEK